MTTIRLATRIHAPPDRCFDLARSIELHLYSARGSSERAVSGVCSGLIGPGQQVTWQARHFGIWHHLTVSIDAFDRPNHFRDRMIRGSFNFMVHDHWFLPDGPFTLMTDRFTFESPLGILGKFVDRLILREYLDRFLLESNELIKRIAESQQWHRFLPY